MHFIGLLYRKDILLHKHWQLLGHMGDRPTHSLVEVVVLTRNGERK